VGLVLVALAALLLAAGCGFHHPGHGVASSGTLNALAERSGEDVAMVGGASDFSPGVVRLPFLVVRHDARAVYRPKARVWIATGRDARPFEQTLAVLEPIGVPGISQPAAGHVTKLYVASFRIPRPGRYWMLAEPIGGSPIQALGIIDVKRRTTSLALGAKAVPSRTPTLASTHGNLAKLTTRTPPDRGLLRYSVADSLAARKPFVVVFATPKFCTSRTCGPVVDVVDKVRRQFAGSGVRFIHVEVYKNNDPSLGYNRWMREWGLQTEPWVFLVGRDGRVKAKFEGSLSVRELAAAVRRLL
jgi:hypothetical protein